MLHKSMTAISLALLPTSVFAATPAEVVINYADIAQAAYGDSLITAQNLRNAVSALVESPSDKTLNAAREAWTAARAPYLQTEAYRFGNPVVDDWEGRVNAWPLDEGLIDYVSPEASGAADNSMAQLDVIANPTFELSGKTVDATKITPELISATLHEAGGIEANVASGYHAIEFLLWGQDLHGTGPGKGERPFTDYVQGEGCTGGNCDRRGDYLVAVSDLLISDLQEMVADWAKDGAARKAVTENPQLGLNAILKGMGSLSYGELAGERMKLGLLLNDPEEEQDCFSDQTHLSHYYDGLGIQNVYLGHYTRIDGSTVSGPSLSELVTQRDPQVDEALKSDLDTTIKALRNIQEKAKNGMAYDQMLAPGNAEGEATINAAIDALVTQTKEVGRAAAALGLDKIDFEGSDSLDKPDSVFK